MSGGGFEITVWGARGSLPVAGPDFAEFGGNTICLELRCGDNVLFFDAGSGAFPAGRALVAEGLRNISFFFSHCHYDHIMGLPFFKPLYFCGTEVAFWASNVDSQLTTEDMMCGFMRKPYFPVDPKVFRADVTTHDFRPGDVLTPCPEITLRTAMLSHPGGAIGYRIEYRGKVLAMVFDTDHVPGMLDPAVLSLIEGADLFFYDAAFTDEEFDIFRDFGHSTWQQGVRLAKAANAGRVAFIHHSPHRTDEELRKIEKLAQAEFPGAFCARDFQKITV